jgi:aldose sugar dehydrogenase
MRLSRRTAAVFVAVALVAVVSGCVRPWPPRRTTTTPVTNPTTSVTTGPTTSVTTGPSTSVTTGPSTTTTTTTTAPAPGDRVITTVLSGLSNPWDIAFTPAGQLLFTERSGTINVVAGGARRQLARPADAAPRGEGGMMGLAVDPAYATNRRIYSCFATQNDVRVVRWVVNAGETALSGRTDILTGMPVNPSGRHSGCRLRFGPDGFLWVTVGDTANAPLPQDPQSFGGKILRITTDGAGAPGNPGGRLRPEIYTYGHRNPQGVAWRPSDGQAFSIEHGTSRDDEINRLVPGANYGWDPRGALGAAFYDESQPMTNRTKYPDALEAVWSSGAPCVAPSGGTFLTGAAWGRLEGAFAVAELRGQRLQVFTSLTPGSVRFELPITNRGRLRVAVQGPDNALYIATDSASGSILRVPPAAIL